MDIDFVGRHNVYAFCLKCCFFIFYFFMGYYLCYHQVFSVGGLRGFASDTQQHIGILKSFFKGEYYLPHPLWHILTKGISEALFISIENAAVLSSSLLMLFWVILVYKLAEKVLKDFLKEQKLYREFLLLSVTFVIAVVGPMYLPFYEVLIYKGQGSPNIWHNVTLWTVKPFALLAIVFSIEALKSQSVKVASWAILSTILSVFAKPNFILIFLPALVVLIIFCYRNRFALFFFSVLSLFVGGILLYQFQHTYGHGSEIIFDFLGVWSLKTQNIGISIFLAIAFPLLFLLLYQKAIESEFILLSWVQLSVGIMLFALFAEKGHKYFHGNFGWSYMLGLSFLYLFSILEFVKVFSTFVFWKKFLLSTLLLYQTCVGIYYLWKILQGVNPIYVGI